MKPWWALLLALSAGAQDVPVAQRPGNADDGSAVRLKDLSGRSVKTPRVRAIHTADPALEGGSAYLLFRDPWLGYQRGRELFLREFTTAEGVFGGPGKAAGPPLVDGVTPLLTGSHATSCALCHNTPFRDGGAGATVFKNAGTGRNTTHLFGGGLLEMLGAQLRLKLLALGDLNRNGFIDKGEAATVRALIEPTENDERAALDFGSFGDADGDGKPDLNAVCFVWYVNAQGLRLSAARTLNDPEVAGYNFEVQIFGWGHAESVRRRVPLSSTLRGFSTGAFHLHVGLQPYDPTLLEEPKRDGLCGISLAGAQQFFTAKPADRGRNRDAYGMSLDDPDRDGVPEELTQGDLDLLEFYLLNHPAPAETYRDSQRQLGLERFERFGCVRCHVPDWQLEAAAPNSVDYTRRYTGDRRFFRLEVQPSGEDRTLQGRLVDLTWQSAQDRVAKRGSFTIRGVYSDFLYHDLGPDFHEMQFDGSVVTHFRTAPLWGVGSTTPYGHDGASLDLDAVIRRHGGDAAVEAQRYVAATSAEREALLAFLRGLVLYSVDDLPCDIDGDGAISSQFIVSEKNTGIERLNPEWLFKVPGKMEGLVRSPDGRQIISRALLNVEAAYGCNLELLIDRDGDGFPDIRQRK